jgi:ABC-type multidrug transport system fused ATPase/permease subunit
MSARADDGRPAAAGAVSRDGRPRQRPWWEVMDPEGSQGGVRDLPKLVADSLRLVWAAGRNQFLVTAGLQLATALGIAAQLFITKALLDAVLVAGGTDDFASLLPELAALVAITVALDLAGAIVAEQSRVLGELVGRRAFDRVLDVSTRIELLAFESPDFYDQLTRARAQGMFRSLQTVNGLVGLVGSVVAAAGIVIALFALQPLLLPLVIIGYVPLLLVSARNSRDLYRFVRGMTPNERQRDYLGSVLTRRDPAKEVRAFGTAGFLRVRYDRLYDERIRELRSLARRRTWRSLVGSVASAAVTALTVAALAYLFVSGRMDVGTAGAAVFGLYQLGGRLRGLYTSATSLYEATLFIRDYASFLELEPSLDGSARPAPRRFERLETADVWFTYPDAAEPAVAGVSLEINAGEVVALVGENGSGKTTLAKIVAGLYRPQAGRVLWDGVDVADVDQDELRDSIAAIFQDFQRYLLPARENIGMGRHARIDDVEAIVTAAERADAHSFLSNLPESYETMLGREFAGGYDLSIGQWQRIALARAFFRDAPLVILDEPTASLDARAESRLFDRMRELLEGRSVLLISHRFSSVRSADRIYVLDEGRVVEHGSHDELMAAAGRYADLFTLQARAYLGE